MTYTYCTMEALEQVFCPAIVSEIANFIVSFEDAIETGNIRALRPWSDSAMLTQALSLKGTQWFDLAVENDHLPVVKWLAGKGARGTKILMCAAASDYGGGRLSKWLRAHCRELGFTMADLESVDYDELIDMFKQEC